MRCGVVPALRAYVGTRPMRRAVEAPARRGAGRDSSRRSARAVVGERFLQALPGQLFTHAVTPVPTFGKDV